MILFFSILLLLFFWICHRSFSSSIFDSIKYKYKKGSISYNIESGLLRKHLLHNKGKKFNNSYQENITKHFNNSKFGRYSLQIAIDFARNLHED